MKNSSTFPTPEVESLGVKIEGLSWESKGALPPNATPGNYNLLRCDSKIMDSLIRPLLRPAISWGLGVALGGLLLDSHEVACPLRSSNRVGSLFAFLCSASPKISETWANWFYRGLVITPGSDMQGLKFDNSESPSIQKCCCAQLHWKNRQSRSFLATFLGTCAC